MRCSLIILMYQKTRAQDDTSAANSDSLFDSPMEMRMFLQLPFRLPSPAWCASLEDPAPGGGLNWQDNDNNSLLIGLMRGLGRERKRSWKSKKEGDKDRNIYSTGVQDKISNWNQQLTFCVSGERVGRDLKSGFTSLTLFIGNMIIFISKLYHSMS